MSIARALLMVSSNSAAGTLSGAPKIRAMQIIDELEPTRRGAYGGSVGYLSYTGDLDRAEELLADEKERAEHVMLVDLARNDLGRVCEFGTVSVDELMVVETYSHVLHIVSSVSGTLKEGVSALDGLRASLPAGTLSGAPKIRAMQIIDELEPVRRGPYGGSVGYLSYTGDLDTCIYIRSALVKDGRLHIQAGGGIVADSDPDYEVRETEHKAGAVFGAIELACRQADWS